MSIFLNVFCIFFLFGFRRFWFHLSESLRVHSLFQAYRFHEIVEFLLEELLVFLVRASRIDIDIESIFEMLLDDLRRDSERGFFLLAEFFVDPFDLFLMAFEPTLRQVNVVLFIGHYWVVAVKQLAGAHSK